MTSLPAKVIAIEKRGDQYQVIVQIGTKYRGSFNTLAFGEIKPYSGSLKDGRLNLVYYRDPGLKAGDQFPLWTLHLASSGSPRTRSPAFRRGYAPAGLQRAQGTARRRHAEEHRLQRPYGLAHGQSANTGSG